MMGGPLGPVDGGWGIEGLTCPGPTLESFRILVVSLASSGAGERAQGRGRLQERPGRETSLRGQSKRRKEPWGRYRGTR